VSEETVDQFSTNSTLTSENTPSEEETHAHATPQATSVPAIVQESSTPTLAGARSDKGQTHFSRHGLLSRDVERSLVRLGEPIKNIRRWERKFRSDLKVNGDVAELIFDKWWSCYVRQLLIAKLEAGAFAGDNSNRVSLHLPVLEERTQPTLVSLPQNESDVDSRHQPTDDLLHRLTLIQRYDSHYSREGNRMFALLLLMRDGGEETLVKIFRASLGSLK
jgi:hypothetical protein